MSSRPTDSCPSVSYFGLTAFTPARCSMEYSSIEAWPIDSTKRSRSGQMGFCGSNRRWRCQSAYATGAMAIGVPGWPELACWTASIASVRMVLTESVSMSVVVNMRGRHSLGVEQTMPQLQRPMHRLRSVTLTCSAKTGAQSSRDNFTGRWYDSRLLDLSGQGGVSMAFKRFAVAGQLLVGTAFFFG